MQYKVNQKASPIDRSIVKYYAFPVYGETVGVAEIAKDLSDATTLNRVDVVAVLEGFLTRLPQYIARGNRVNLKNFGIFKMGFHSKGSLTYEEVTAQNIYRPHVNFLPSAEMKETIESSVSFSKVLTQSASSESGLNESVTQSTETDD